MSKENHPQVQIFKPSGKFQFSSAGGYYCIDVARAIERRDRSCDPSLPANLRKFIRQNMRFWARLAILDRRLSRGEIQLTDPSTD